MGSVGTLEWNHRTRGVLRARDYAELAAQAVGVQLRLLGRSGRARLGLGSSGEAELDLASIVIPDSAAAREAADLCEEHSPGYLAAHCHRSYLWAHVIGTHKAMTWDAEQLYVATLLHDIGLTEHFANAPGAHRCFTLRAEAPITTIGNRNGWSAQRSETAAEAVSLHINAHVGSKYGSVAQLTQVGSACDAIGLGLGGIASNTRAAILARHPRQQLKREITSDLRCHGGATGTRTNFLLTVGEFEKRVRSANFAE